MQLGSVQFRSASQQDTVFRDNLGAEKEWNWSQSFVSVAPAVRRPPVVLMFSL